jgi:hypothetical protein
MTDSERHIKNLKIRLDYLDAKAVGMAGSRAWLDRERTALRWALPILSVIAEAFREETFVVGARRIREDQGTQRQQCRGFMIVTRSRRTLFTAAAIAGIPLPMRSAEAGECFLRLLIAGVDHSWVGSEEWVKAILDVEEEEDE